MLGENYYFACLFYTHSTNKLNFDLYGRKLFINRLINSIRSDEGLTLETSASESLYGGQFTLSTQLIKPNYLAILPPTQHHSFFRNLPPLINSITLVSFLSNSWACPEQTSRSRPLRHHRFHKGYDSAIFI